MYRILIFVLLFMPVTLLAQREETGFFFEGGIGFFARQAPQIALDISANIGLQLNGRLQMGGGFSYQFNPSPQRNYNHIWGGRILGRMIFFRIPFRANNDIHLYGCAHAEILKRHSRYKVAGPVTIVLNPPAWITDLYFNLSGGMGMGIGISKNINIMGEMLFYVFFRKTHLVYNSPMQANLRIQFVFGK